MQGASRIHRKEEAKEERKKGKQGVRRAKPPAKILIFEHCWQIVAIYRFSVGVDIHYGAYYMFRTSTCEMVE